MLKVIGGAQEGEFKAVASGTLPNGKPVVVNADGTVSVAAETAVSQVVGSPTTFQSGNTEATSAAYDTNAQRVVVAYKDDTASNGKAVVGTVSGTSISFGTPVVFESGITDFTSTVYDSSAQKIVIAYRDSSDSDGKVIVGTVSGTSISFGTAVEFTAHTLTFVATTYDSNAEKVIIAYSDGNASNAGKAIVGTVSGTSISLGSAAQFESGVTQDTSIAYDSNAQKVVLSYRDNSNSGYGTSIVGTVSGTSISFGTPVVFESANTDFTSTVYDSNAQKIVVFYEDEGNSDYGTAIVGTVSGTSISFGTPVVFESAETQEISASYDVNAQKVVVAYKDGGNSNKGTIAVGTVSGTSISFDTPVVFEAGATYKITTTYDSDAQKVVVAYRDNNDSLNGKGVVFQTAHTSANLTSENYIGMSSGAVTPSVNGTKTSFNSSAIGSEVTGSVYDPDTGKIIICYTRGSDNHGLAVVGTVSGTTLSFGTPVVFNAAVTDHTDITYDTANNKVLIVYKNVGNNNYGTAIVGTVSGTSISFGTPVVYFSARSHNNKATFDTNAGKSLVVWLDDDNNDVESAVATISGTSVSFGSTVTVDANANYDEVVFDSNSNKVVVVYRDLGNSNYGTAIVGTISGTSVSFGSEVVFNAGSTSDIHCAFDSTNNKVIISFKAGSDGDKAKAIVGTVSGTSISFGSLATINDAASQQPKPVYNSVQQELIFEYELSGNGLYYRTASVSGTSIVNIGSQVTLASGFDALVSNLVYHPTENVAVVGFKDSGDSNKGNAIAFSTEVRGEVASGGAATVDIIGSLSTNQGSLTAGQQYFVQTDGTIGLTAADPSVLAGTAISATELLVKT